MKCREIAGNTIPKNQIFNFFCVRWMRELYEDEYDFFYQDWYAHILPKIEVINAFDFVSYCRYYSKVWDRLSHLPMYMIEKKFWPSIKSLERINDIITKTIWIQIFSIEKTWEKDWETLFRTELWLYIIYNSLNELFFNWDDYLEDILVKLFTWFYITVSPNCREWALLWENMFVDKSMDRYEDFAAHFAWDFFTHILLYHKLKRNWNNPISIRKNIVIQPSIETNENRNWKYTLTKHKKYSKFLSELLKEAWDKNIEMSENIGDYFDVVIHEDPCLLFWYILFNEFILWNHIIFCHWDYLWFRNKEWYPFYANYFIVNKELIWDFVYQNSNVFCTSLINHWYEDIYSKRIAHLPIVKELRSKLTNRPLTTQNKKDEELNQSYEAEVIKEIELMRTTTDKSDITVEIRNKEVKLMRSNFQVNDISRIKEIRDFTNQNWWAHIEHYDYGKRYIKWDRLKNIWGKKWKYDWNEDSD